MGNRGGSYDTVNQKNYHMSVNNIARELNIPATEVVATLYKALNKLRRNKYKHLEEYQYDDLVTERSSTFGSAESSIVRSEKHHSFGCSRSSTTKSYS